MPENVAQGWSADPQRQFPTVERGAQLSGLCYRTNSGPFEKPSGLRKV